MPAEAARLIAHAADINSTFLAKMTDFSKSMELYIKAGKFIEADASFAKAIACANTENEKFSLKIKRKELIKQQAKDYLIKDKRRTAVEAYEKLLSIDLTPSEKKDAQTTLINLYEKLGMIREFYALKRAIG
jgi:tetratricopeptide (TPR) repeat protein